MKGSALLFVGLGLILGLVLVAGTLVFTHPHEYQGSLINPPYPAAEFKLVDQHGQPAQLKDQRGKITLLFFGYSHCTDICPATLAEFKQIRRQLGSLSDQVDFIFITVDPANDTSPVLEAYLAKFDPAIIGLTGTRDQLMPVWQAYGVSAQNQTSAANLDGMIDHSTYIYLIDRAGYMRETFNFGDPIAGMLSDVRYWLKG